MRTDVATVVAPISAAVKHLQAATGADQAGCHAMLPRIASAYPTLGGDASPDDECVLISKHDVEVLTILLSHFASKRPRIARTSSGGALKATLQKKFSDRSDVFDEATQEYMLDLTETKVLDRWCAPARQPRLDSCADCRRPPTRTFRTKHR